MVLVPTSAQAPAAPRARRRAATRRDPAAADPAPARPRISLDDRHPSAGDLLREDHLDRPRPAGADDARQRRPRPVDDLRERMMRSRAQHHLLLATATPPGTSRWRNPEQPTPPASLPPLQWVGGTCSTRKRWQRISVPWSPDQHRCRRRPCACAITRCLAVSAR
jgi:hypothetical protein